MRGALIQELLSWHWIREEIVLAIPVNRRKFHEAGLLAVSTQFFPLPTQSLTSQTLLRTSAPTEEMTTKGVLVGLIHRGGG